MLSSLISCGPQTDWDEDNSGPGRYGVDERNVQKHKPKMTSADSNEYQLHHRAKMDSSVKGIYISQTTVENRKYLQYLINRSKQAGINTFIIDLNAVSNTYEKNLLLVKNSGIRFVARVVVFPIGDTTQNVHSEAYWMSRFRLVDAAIRLGADEIQLDYNRYVERNSSSSQSLLDIHESVCWFRDKIDNRAKLQIDMFGNTTYKQADQSAQTIATNSKTVDAVCPMVYPSHFEPHQEHAHKPYDVVYTALTTLKQSYNQNDKPFELYPYIELSNYRHGYTDEQLVGYIHSQIKAVEDAKADGWYAWSAGNKYDRLFTIMTEA